MPSDDGPGRGGEEVRSLTTSSSAGWLVGPSAEDSPTPLPKEIFCRKGCSFKKGMGRGEEGNPLKIVPSYR